MDFILALLVSHGCKSSNYPLRFLSSVVHKNHEKILPTFAGTVDKAGVVKTWNYAPWSSPSNEFLYQSLWGNTHLLSWPINLRDSSQFGKLSIPLLGSRGENRIWVRANERQVGLCWHYREGEVLKQPSKLWMFLSTVLATFGSNWDCWTRWRLEDGTFTAIPETFE